MEKHFKKGSLLAEDDLICTWLIHSSSQKKKCYWRCRSHINTVQIQINWFIQFSPWKRSTKLRHSKGNKSVYCYGYQLKSAKMQYSGVHTSLGRQDWGRPHSGYHEDLTPKLNLTAKNKSTSSTQPSRGSALNHHLFISIVKHRRNSVEKYKNRRVTNQETWA